MTAVPRLWPQPDGQPVACQDKLDILEDNHEELRHVMQDAFEDAILMGVDAGHMRRLIAGLVENLKAPK